MITRRQHSSSYRKSPTSGSPSPNHFDGKENIPENKPIVHSYEAAKIDLANMKPYEAVSTALTMLHSNAEEW